MLRNYEYMKKEIKSKKKTSSAKLGFEEELWKSADSLRKNMDASEYKHIVLGLLFLKYVSDSFEERHQQLLQEKSLGADPEDKDEYLGHNVFWISKNSRWGKIQDAAKKPTIGQIIDDAMVSIEKENKSLKGVLPKDYSRPSLDKQNLGKLIDIIGNIKLGDKENRSKDILGRVYEYFLGKFASAEGKGAGQFYTPGSIVHLLVDMIEPFHGRVLDPCCGSGGMFVQSERFIQSHEGKKDDISIYGQESNQTTWRLCKMNLAIRQIDGNVKWNNEGSFLKDEHKGLEADYILANPPFNDSDWSGDKLKDDPRWKFGTPPEGNANFAWVQHFIHHLSKKGLTGFVLGNGSLASNSKCEREIRAAIIDNDLLDCVISLPGKLFYSTPIPASLWFLTRNKKSKSNDRREKTLFINAREMGTLIGKSHRELTDLEIKKIADTYHSWKGDKDAGKYKDEIEFCREVKKEEIMLNNYIFTPGLYIKLKDVEKDIVPFEQKISQLTSSLKDQMKQSQKIDKKIDKYLGSVN